ncbi:MAG: hypothetical protein JWM68_694 [Verrucomicrobiales bacterium]|nr:hypothetical protein [Verrucomicrobiales bacterium]
MACWKREPFALERYKQLFEEDWIEGQSDMVMGWDGEEEQHRESAWTTLEHYFRETPIKPDERPEAVEVCAEAELPGLPRLIGIIDLIRAGGRIVDFKSAAKTPDVDQLAHQNEVQTSCYALLYRDSTGRMEQDIELHHLVKTKTPKLVVTALGPMTDHQEMRLYRTIESYVEGMERQDFVPSPGLHCSSCEFYQECRRWNGKELCPGAIAG